MRSMLLAAVAVLVSLPASAVVLTIPQQVSAPASVLRDGALSVELTPFNSALGTVTSARLTFSGNVDTGAQPVRIFPGDTVPVAVNLASFVELAVGSTRNRESLPARTSFVVNGAALPVTTPYQFSLELPIAPSYLASPFVNLAAFTLVTRTDGISLNNAGSNSDTTSAGGTLTLAYTYTAAATAVPEPVSLSLLTLGLAGLAVTRRRQAVV